jgi:hypothetical protein
MMFVGIARATQWVYMSSVKGTEFGDMAVLRGAAAQGHLTMQDGAGYEKPDTGSGDSGRKAEDDKFSVL